MLINIEDLIKKYDIKIKGIIHVGGHVGEEVPLYKKYTNNIHIFEPQEECFDKIDPTVKKYCVALGETEGIMDFYIANNKQSSSLLEPKEHLKNHPEVKFLAKKQVIVKKLDSYELFDCNFLNMDTQGFELEVLKGSTKTIDHIDYIYTEINTTETYKNCPLVEDLDCYLTKFIRVETEIYGNCGWGDAFYVNKNILKENQSE